MAAGCVEKTKMSRIPSVAAVTGFLKRVRRAAAFQRVQRWPDVVVAAMEVAAVECGGYGVGWCGRERE